MDKYHGQRRHSPAQETRQSQKNVNQNSTAGSAWLGSSSDSQPDYPVFIISLWHLACFAYVQVRSCQWPARPLPLEAFCFVRDLMCFSSCEVLLWINPKSFPLPVKMRRGAGSHQILELLCRAAIARNSIQIYWLVVFFQNLRENRALDIGLLLCQHDNQTVQMVSLAAPWQTARCSLIRKNPRG